MPKLISISHMVTAEAFEKMIEVVKNHPNKMIDRNKTKSVTTIALYDTRQRTIEYIKVGKNGTEIINKLIEPCKQQ